LLFLLQMLVTYNQMSGSLTEDMTYLINILSAAYDSMLYYFDSDPLVYNKKLLYSLESNNPSDVHTKLPLVSNLAPPDRHPPIYHAVQRLVRRTLNQIP